MPRLCLFLLLLALALAAGCRSVSRTTTVEESTVSPAPEPSAPAVHARPERSRTAPTVPAVSQPRAPQRQTPSPAAPQPLEIVALGSDMWSHTSWDEQTGEPANGLIVREPQRLVLVDVPLSAGATHELLHWAEQELNQPISRVIITHATRNHLAGARVLEAQHIPLMALAPTATQWAALGGSRPNTLGDLAPGASVRIGTIELYYPALSHRPDAAAVWLRDMRLLYGSCIVTNQAATAVTALTPAARQTWAAAIRRMLQRYPEATIIVPESGAAGARELLHLTLRLLATAADPGEPARR
jgi:metallo-beta-lactamase class B